MTAQPMEIRQCSQNDVTLIRLLGRLDELATADVEQAFTRALEMGAQRIVVDLLGVEYISSSGLRVLLMLSRAMKQQQRQLKLCGLSPFVAEVFAVSNFTSLFEIYPAEAEAIRAFASESA